MTHIFTSRSFAVLLLIVSTVWDAGGTWLTVGRKLYLDGNPVVQSLNWTQLLVLLLVLHTALAVGFWFAWSRQEALWPNQRMSFWRFLSYRLKKGFALNFSRDHLKTEFIWAGMLLLWLPTFAHLLAGLIITSPLVGGPSFLDVFRRLGVDNWRTAQTFTSLFIIVAALILAHWPLYLRYRACEGDRSVKRQA